MCILMIVPLPFPCLIYKEVEAWPGAAMTTKLAFK